MNQKLQDILNNIQQSEKLDAEQKENLLKAVKEADKEFEITAFKLERTEKVKKTTAILLEETIEELEQKRKAVEAQNRELEIEASLERVRAIALSMKESADMLEVCRTIANELSLLNVKEIRNVQTAIIYESKGTYLNYEYYAKHDKALITEVDFSIHHLQELFINQMLNSTGELFSKTLKGKEVKDWYDHQKTTNQFADTYLEKAKSLTYYWYSLGPVALGISTYYPLSDDEIILFKRFLNVFELAYRRFLDIEKALEQAREAQIELALERVRARTMAMHKSDELSETAYVLFEQFRELGENPDQLTIGTVNETEKILELWLSVQGSKVEEMFRVPIEEPVVISKIYNAWKDGKKSIVLDISGDDLKKYESFRNSLPEFKTYNHLKSLINKEEERRVIHCTFFQRGLLSLATPEPRPEETLKILERFASVFNLTYTRFLDLQKAEAQAREAEIQLALERVRARTMAMHKSEELSETTFVLFRQFVQLGVAPNRFFIGTMNEEETTFDVWITEWGGEISSQNFKVNIEEPLQWNKVYEAWKAHDRSLVVDINGEDLIKWNEYLEGIGFPVKNRKSVTRLVNTFAIFSNGFIAITTSKITSTETVQLLERFADVFNLTYRRFLDLQKAEAQAREAQIEAALERVRSRTMGMQKSEELKEVIQLVYEQFVHLRINVDHAGFVVDYKPKGDWHFWIADQHEIPSKITHPYFDSVWAHQFNEAKEKGIDFFAINLNFEEKNKFYTELLAYVPGLPEKSKEFYLSCPGLAATTVLFDNVSLYIENFSGTPYSDEENKILMRFGKVFQQTYTRFLDLQKAELQAREAQIEASLERVRAVAMSMNKSEDLLSICEVSFKEFKKLGFDNIRNALIHIQYDEQKYFMDYDFSDLTGGAITKIEYGSHPIVEEYLQQIRSAKDAFYQGVIKEDQLEEWKNFRRNSGQIDDPRLEEATALYYYFFSIGVGDIGISTLQPIDESQIKILKRFRNVFDLAYRRYNDITIAEEQARETQIQLALERVRARTMAMHKSEELSETSFVLFEQLKELGEVADQISIMIYDEKEKVIELYATIYGSQWEETGRLPFEESSVHKKIYAAWKEKKKSLVVDLTGKGLNDFNNFKMKYSKQYKSEEELPKNRWVVQNAFFSKGVLTFSTYEPRPLQTLHLLERFAGVFDLTYTRFLDLKKAEERAREAQIEAALEKVRSRSMAMHHTSELQDVINSVYQQFKLLDIDITGGAFIAINEENNNEITCWGAGGTADYVERVHIPLFDKPIYKGLLKCIKKGTGFYTEEFSYEEKIEFFNHLFKHPPYTNASLERKNEIMSRKGGYTRSCNVSKHTSVFIINHHGQKFSEAENNILKRFGKVFEQSYTRFLDLQKAEEQAREAQIEASLEKVRAEAMSMHKSDDLLNVSEKLFAELKTLGFSNLRNSLINILNDETKIFVNYDYSDFLGGRISNVSYDSHPINVQFVTQIRKSSDVLVESVINRKQLNEWKEFRRRNGEEDDPRLDGINALYYYEYSIGTGSIGISNFTPISEEQQTILKRFRNVFNLSYQRYIDISQAEAQAREAEIEAALERVRSRTMAMQKSNELAETASHFFEQLNSLGIKPYRFNIAIVDTDSEKCQLWSTTNEGKVIPLGPMIPLTEYKVFNQIYDGWKQQKNVSVIRVEGEERITWTKYIMRYVSFNEYRPENIDLEKLRSEPAIFSNFFFKQGFVVVHTIEEIIETDIKIIQRFVNVFEQTYTRFLDLKNAEAQAREAEIQLALERVRARTMAMHKSSELAEVAKVLFDQMSLLDNTPDRFNIRIINEAERAFEFWATDQQGNLVDKFFKANFDDSPIVMQMYKSWKANEKILIQDIHGDQLIEWVHYIKDILGVPFSPQNLKEHRFLCSFFFSHGMIGITTNEAPNQVTLKLIERFTIVFQQTYTRFLDLKKAEAQAREAQIEAALERVRAKAMAMHSSDDLSETMGVLFIELPKLGINSLRCGVVLLSSNNTEGKFYAAATTQESDSFTMIGSGDMTKHPVFMRQYERWLQKENYFVTLSGEELQSYYKEIFARLSKTYNPKEHPLQTEHGYYFSFSEGMFYAWSEEPYSEESISILNRFNSIINLTFRRYLDIQKAEAQAKEAIKQAALDRIRGEIASMRTSEDLNYITPIIWRELKNLEVPFFRCGVYIVDETSEMVQVYLTTPDGKSLGVLNLSFGSNEITSNTVDNWRKKIVYKTHWNKEEFINWTESMMKLGQIKSAETYQGSTTPPESLYLHFVPFTQGMLYVGDIQPLADEKLELVKTLAEAFSIAYARYEDFKNLENAKNKIEITLSELKSAQAQLIHSEKMASLGELTAGIAHEIKNPLNFVNNFSEVSRELLDEMKTEIENKNIGEVIELIEDLKQNLDKINQHGKRADSIVKGMLLHSRGTSGEKTPTDINDLLDQYVNLAYHGMRAQNKEFNISIETDYDKTLEKINVVPQDISRVFLNIINNACYAAFDKKKKGDNKFSPTLKVSTKKLNNKVEVIISDNGNGIPVEHLDKIFQPFFTTKPSGEGTGLGLSLSYDIITKVHNGELKVETKINEGSKFIIQLPLS